MVLPPLVMVPAPAVTAPPEGRVLGSRAQADAQAIPRAKTVAAMISLSQGALTVRQAYGTIHNLNQLRSAVGARGIAGTVYYRGVHAGNYAAEDVRKDVGAGGDRS